MNELDTPDPCRDCLDREHTENCAGLGGVEAPYYLQTLDAVEKAIKSGAESSAVVVQKAVQSEAAIICLAQTSASEGFGKCRTPGNFSRPES